MMEKAAAHLNRNFHNHLEDLKELVRIPSVSFPGFPKAEVTRGAEAVAALLKKRGLENVRMLEVPGTFPYVYGERIKHPGKPTLLLYAHYDVQPSGRDELWKSRPFEPEVRPGPGGDRVWGRGTADDKGGILIHASAIGSYLESTGDLPVNVKVLIEGEEETGSVHVEELLSSYRDLLCADLLILTDTGNYDCGMPAVTTSLRGLVSLEVEVRALVKTVHSGMFGGPVPDPAMALSKVLASLVDENGRIVVPEIMKQVRPMSREEEKDFSSVPYDEAEFRKQSGMVPGARLLREENPAVNPMMQTWRFPSLAVNAIQSSSRAAAGNIINDTAWAKVSVRLVPDMDPQKVYQQLCDYLRARTPWGLEISFRKEACSPAWSISPKGYAFDALDAAMTRAFGVVPYRIGYGGSVFFVKPFTELLGGIPALLIGVEDPYTNAHGENESVLLDDLKKACLSQVYLFGELAKRTANFPAPLRR